MKGVIHKIQFENNLSKAKLSKKKINYLSNSSFRLTKNKDS